MIDIRFHQGAAHELREAARYYELQVAGLGLAFIADVERTTTRILENPTIGATTWRHYRRMLVRRFPFTVFYRPREAMLYVVAVAHHHRQPNYWQTRAWDWKAAHGPATSDHALPEVPQQKTGMPCKLGKPLPERRWDTDYKSNNIPHKKWSRPDEIPCKRVRTVFFNKCRFNRVFSGFSKNFRPKKNPLIGVFGGGGVRLTSPVLKGFLGVFLLSPHPSPHKKLRT